MILKTLIKSRQILNQFLAYKISPSDAWDLKVFMKKVQPELEVYDEEEAKLIKKFGKETKKDLWEIKADDTIQFGKYIAAISPVLEKEVKTKPPKIDHKPLIKDKSLKIPAQIFIELDWLFV